MFPSVMDSVVLNGSTVFAEPFCGGAGLSLMMLDRGVVDRVWINDLDPAVYAMWHSFLNDTDAMCDFVETVPVTMDSWHRFHDVLEERVGSKPKPDLELAEAALFLNRTNRSGILLGGVIGGKGQDGPYKIDARFTRETLVSKIRRIGAWSRKIRLTPWDGVDMIGSIRYRGMFLFCDPPYVGKGPELYGTAMDADAHRRLRDALAGSPCPWMLTYDDRPDVRSLYGGFDLSLEGKWYTAQSRGVVNELVVRGNPTPNGD